MGILRALQAPATNPTDLQGLPRPDSGALFTVIAVKLIEFTALSISAPAKAAASTFF